MIKQLTSSLKKKFSSQTSLDQMEQSIDLCKYASLGNLEKIKELHAKGYNINNYDYDGRTPLHLAAANGHFDSVKWLIENGALLRVDRFGKLPTNEAKINNHTEIYELMNNVDIDIDFNEIKNHPKKQIIEEVTKILILQGVFNQELIAAEVDYFIRELGMDPFYFTLCDSKQIAKHIHGLICAKKTAQIRRNPESLELSMNDNQQKFYMCSSSNQMNIEKQIEEQIQTVQINKSLSFIHMKSRAPIYKGGKEMLDIYIVKELDYLNPQCRSNKVEEICNNTFQLKPKDAQERYKELLIEASNSVKPVTKQFKTREGDIGIMFAVNQGITDSASTKHFSYTCELTKSFSSLKADAYKKYIETFSNGIVIYSFYFTSLDQKTLNSLKDISQMWFSIPFNELSELFLNDKLTGRQFLYAYCASRFAYYFATLKFEEFDALYDHLEQKNNKMKNKLINLKQTMQKENFALHDIYKICEDNQGILKDLYIDFSRKMVGDIEGYKYPDIQQKLSKVNDPKANLILKSFHKFNQSVVKTNFYNTSKSATAFRMDPNVFCKDIKLPEIPFGIFMIIGRDFNGFHVRFRDIARGGIRIIKSTAENYPQNRITQFNENYNLAYTQKLKNKDIAESGSKGTILLRQNKNYTAKLSFDQYIDAMSDLKLGVDGVIDLYKKPEFLFMGPDENTADLMDQAALSMKKKGYSFWKSFTTGKSKSLGGIPHDTYGMTTRSVRQYTIGIQRKLGLNPSECTKFMTGGPDGDLGSNEILMGTEKIVAVVDGSGVLYDPQGICRQSLLELVKKRQMISNFQGKLSEQGYKVLTTDENITLPCGKEVESGTNFRNKFHLEQSITADFLVPCGGRPESININNVDEMFNKDGTPRFKYVIEGANLFITESARHILEDRGVILFKDASTNKGGVTSSSLEVLASLCLNDQEFAENMLPAADGTVPKFYNEYVQDIINIIEENARKEFEYIYQRRLITGIRSVEITNQLSENMNNLFDIIVKSDLFLNQEIKKNVMRDCIPKNLQKLVGLDTIMQRVPETYLRSLFAKFLSKEYYYNVGSQSNVYNFYEFMNKYNDQN